MKSKHWAWATLGLALAVLGAHICSVFGYPLGNDPSIFQYHAWGMGVGQVPYKDTFEFNTPGIIALHWAIGSLVGYDDAAFQAVVMAVAALCLLGTAVWLRRRVSPWALVLGLTVGLWGLVGITPWDRGQRELFQGALLLLAFGLAGDPHGRYARTRAGLAGVVCGLVVGIKLTALILVWAAWLPWLKRQRSLQPGVITFVGLLLPLTGLVAWLWSMEALGGFIHSQTLYLPLHAGMTRVPLADALLHKHVALIAVCGALALVPWRGPHRWALWSLGVAMLMTVALYLGQAQGWTYHLHLALPLVAPAVALTANSIERTALLAGGSAVMLILAAMGVKYDLTDGLHRGIQVDEHWNHASMVTVANHIRNNGPADDRVLTNNTEHQLLLLAQRRVATPFLYGWVASESHPEPELQTLGVLRASAAAVHNTHWVVWNTRPYKPDLDSWEQNPILALWIRNHCTQQWLEADPYEVYYCGPPRPLDGR